MEKYRYYIVLVSVGILVLVYPVSNTRSERSLVYIDGGNFKFNVGLGVPVAVPKRFISWGYNFQFQYDLPDNATKFTDFAYLGTLNKRSSDEEEPITRELIYDALARVLEKKGYNGRECVLRAICEITESPVDHNGLLGEILHVIFTPNYGMGDGYFIDNDYFKAQKDGQNYWISCLDKYRKCPPGHGILDLISVFDY